IDVKDQDIKWERMRAGGAGGQHVNKTESAVRIWYKQGTPEEMEVKCQDERSQHKNYDRTMRILRSRRYERQQQKLPSQRTERRPGRDDRQLAELDCTVPSEKGLVVSAPGYGGAARACPALPAHRPLRSL